ncbi:MAG: DUF1566 domain-containing protein [Candidatus Hydrogenedentes bacterium]|nr:DUF1566 domain-containing protein [Candidatus Hydrogenedentota bacterium]
MKTRWYCIAAMASRIAFSQVAEAADLHVATIGTDCPPFNSQRSSSSVMVECSRLSFPVVDTGQDKCYGAHSAIPFPRSGEEFFGQDAQYEGLVPLYRDNSDGTVADVNTGLMWQKTPPDTRFTQNEAEKYAENLQLAGYDDWRLPNIKELFSIADLRGDMHSHIPYIDTRFFDFTYPVATGNRPGMRGMDAQYASSTRYVGITMGKDKSAFGFNFADGRIKSYPLTGKRFVRCVRGNPDYGKNRLRDNGDGTVTDVATGLVWQKSDSGTPMNWKDALRYTEHLRLADRGDWRLPNVKELQSIVDYTRAPDAFDPARRGPAIDPIFDVTQTESWYWTSTTHVETGFAYYVSFGQAFSARTMNGKKINAHGAGAVRSDPKEGENRWPYGLGPQGDEIRIMNYVRCVCGGDAKLATTPASPYAVETQPAMSTRGTRDNAHFIHRLDTNGDGKVSRDEFNRSSRRFDILDTNGDGFISETEALTDLPRRVNKR